MFLSFEEEENWERKQTMRLPGPRSTVYESEILTDEDTV